MKTFKGWEQSGCYFSRYCKPGDAVDDAIFDHFVNILPPRTFSGTLMQVGEPYSHQMDEHGHMRATYGTFAQRGGQWYYCGNCFAGRDTEPCSFI